MNEISKYAEEHNLMFPIHGMTMSGKALIEKDNNGKVVRWRGVPEETIENRAIWNSVIEDLKRAEDELFWGTK